MALQVPPQSDTARAAIRSLWEDETVSLADTKEALLQLALDVQSYLESLDQD